MRVAKMNAASIWSRDDYDDEKHDNLTSDDE